MFVTGGGCLGRRGLGLIAWRRCTREHLVGLLWSDRDEQQARHSLSEALRVLRRALGDDAVRADVDQIQLRADAVALDCDRFAELCARGDWTGAAALVEGEFLEGLSIAEANEFAGLVAYFFFAPSTQVANSWSFTTRTAIGMKA